jgi:hypothetical protein
VPPLNRSEWRSRTLRAVAARRWSRLPEPITRRHPFALAKGASSAHLQNDDAITGRVGQRTQLGDIVGRHRRSVVPPPAAHKAQRVGDLLVVQLDSVLWDDYFIRSDEAVDAASIRPKNFRFVCTEG